MAEKKKQIIDYTAQECKYNPLKDAQKVVPDLGVNIDDMLQTGIVKNSSETLDNNGIDDPSDIIGRITSIFDALDAERVVRKYGKKSPARAQAEIAAISDAKE